MRGAICNLCAQMNNKTWWLTSNPHMYLKVLEPFEFHGAQERNSHHLRYRIIQLMLYYLLINDKIIKAIYIVII